MSFVKRSRTACVALLAVALVCIAAPAHSEPPPGAQWSEHYFPSGDGINNLHADVLRKEGLTDDDKEPVILSVTPYANHSGSTADGTNPTRTGPNPRFYDFLELTDALDRGYTYVMVDLPGTGGSGGCNDWGGVREQGAVKAAVEWAASQPWSTGKVALMGKSYDGWTGLMGMAQQPKGLSAVVSMEPVYSGYRYLYHDGVRFINSFLTGALFQATDAQPGTVNDDPEYHANGAPQAWCYGVNEGLQQQDDPTAPFWVERDLLPLTEKVSTPLFLTQGFMETNTKPDAAFDFFNGLEGPNRAWYGQFDHYRGWEMRGKKYLTGRKTFVAEMMRFLEYHLKGKGSPPTKVDPVIEVQDNLGRYRGEKQWPPADSKVWWSDLNDGTYVDDGRNSGSGPGGGNGLWSISQPLKTAAWMAGEPVVEVILDAIPRANFVVNLYDVNQEGRAVLVSRGAHLMRDASEEVSVDMYGQDWVFDKGHRIAVLLSSANSDWWVHIPTHATVVTSQVRIALPFLKYNRYDFLSGKPTPTLESWISQEAVSIGDDDLSSGKVKFNLPPRLRKR